jgi:hypothetical protein
MHHRHQLRRLTVRQSPQHDGIEDGEDGGRRTETECEGQERHEAEGAVAHQHPRRAPELATERAPPRGPPFLAQRDGIDRPRTLQICVAVAEPSRHLALRLRAGHSRRHELLDPLFHMKAELILELGAEPIRGARHREIALGLLRPGTTGRHRAPSAERIIATASV